MIHIPVLTDEVLKYLNPKPNENFIDATLGEGGHSLAILKKILPKGKILGIELDGEILKIAEEKFKTERIILVNDNFKNLKEIVNTTPNFQKKFGGHYDVSGILFDLGLSSWHLEKSKRGFSFKKNEILDMNYTPKSQSDFGGHRLTAGEIVNTWPKEEIEKILREYSQERFSRRIAKKIIEERKKRPIVTTFDLVKVIRGAVPKNYERGRIHPATRTFQALRRAVNEELENLKKALPQAIEILKKSGRIVVISFDSLEDRIVKKIFRGEAQKGKVKILTKKPIRPTREEMKLNPRARSAKLRAAVKL